MSQALISVDRASDEQGVRYVYSVQDVWEGSCQAKRNSNDNSIRGWDRKWLNKYIHEHANSVKMQKLQITSKMM